MQTFIGNEVKVANQLVDAMLKLRPSITLNGNKLNLIHKGKDFSIPLTKVYAGKQGYIR